MASERKHVPVQLTGRRCCPANRRTTPRAPLTRPLAALTLRRSMTWAPTFSSSTFSACQPGQGSRLRSISSRSRLPSALLGKMLHKRLLTVSSSNGWESEHEVQVDQHRLGLGFVYVVV